MDMVAANNIGMANASIDKQVKNKIIEQVQDKIIKIYEEKRDALLTKEENLSEIIQMTGYQDCITDILKILTEMQCR